MLVQLTGFFSCRLAEGEKTNGRWAMVAVVGILGQEILGVHPAWYLHGEKVRCNFTLSPNYIKYAAMSTA